jgi:hypothetical protein
MTRHKRETVGLTRSAAAGVDTRASDSIFDSVSQKPPLPTHFAIASVASA